MASNSPEQIAQFPQRSIVHLDADAFFVSVEQSADARLRGRPVAVGGEKRGIIASASYEARKYGIYTPMPTAMARRLCPRLILLPGDFEKYELFSRLMFSYAYDFTPDVEIGSIDEGYLDLTGTRNPPVDIANIIRRAIRQGLNLSVSEGIGSNKLISQVASKSKKPAAFEFVPPGDEAFFLSPLPNQWLPGVGPKLANQLKAAGLVLIGQIAQTPADLLSLLIGRMAFQLKNFSLGIDERPIVPTRTSAKSYGEQETFASDTTDEEFLDATLRRMADKLMAKAREDGKSIRTVTVKVRYNDMDEEQASESLDEPTDLETDIYSEVSQLLRKAWRRRVSLRLVSLKLSNIYDGRFHSGLGLDPAAQHHDAEQRLADIVDDLRRKFGRKVLLRGHDFVLRNPKAQTSRRSHFVSHALTHHSITLLLHKSSPVLPIQIRKSKFENQNSPLPYGLAVVARQRLGNYAARQSPEARAREIIHTSPSPELRFRAAPPPRRAPTVHLKSSTVCIPLNVHSYYSFLDSTLSIKAIVDLARRHELPAIALTDKSNLHGAVEFAQAAAEAGIKPIIGAELDWHGQRLCLYVENQTGYHNLCRILSVPKEQSATPPLLSSTDGLLAVSACAELAQFFPNRFYLEINNPEALEKQGAALPCVASFPVHYERPADRWKYDIVQSIRTLTLLRQQHPEKRLAGDYHFRPPAELQRIFAVHPDLLAHSREIADRCNFEFSLGKPQFPGYSAPGGRPSEFLRRLATKGLRERYPNRYASLESQLEQELNIVVDVGYEEYFLVMWDILQECGRHGINWITRGSAADSLVCYCLGISSVCPIRFELYFRRFLNKDRMALNKLPDIDVDFPYDRKDDVIDLIFEKHGRGKTAVVGGFSTFQSRSAFAEVAKVLGVSEFQVRRMTERLPQFSRAGELSEAVAESQECRELPFEEDPYQTALQMAHFLDGFPRYPKMHPCGLVLSRQPMSEITPCFVSAKGYPTTHFDMDSVEAVGLIKMDILAQGGLAVMRDVQEMLRQDQNPMSAGAEPRSHKTHDFVLHDRLAVQGSTFDVKCSKFVPASPPTIESQSSTFDFQSLPPLPPSPVNLAPPLSPPTPFDLEALAPWNDDEVWGLIASGHARAVHHIESPAMISLCKMCNVREIDTLIAIVSVIRPGAANESKKMEFARRYQKLSEPYYPHPSLEPCLSSTFGLVVYEEHILQICEAFAGLPPGRADILRRALGKDRMDVIAEVQAEFADCARKLGRTEAKIAESWDLVVGFKGYAFCKAHSTAYGVEAYQSAWLKHYYPAEFMAAVLTNGKGFYDPLVYILECHRLHIPLLPPFVNEPGPQFTVNDGKIRVPTLNIKGLRRRTREVILQERQRGAFASLHDFFLRVQPLNEEMEALIQAGAFDEFGKTRTTQYWEFKSLATVEMPRAVSRFSSAECDLPSGAKIKNAHQLWLLPPESLDRLPSVPLAEPTRLQRLRWEEDLLGYPVSGHPLELFPDIAWNTYCPVDRLSEHIGEEIVTCGLVIEQRLFHQVTGEPMKFITIADWTGIVETELFARTYKSYGLNTVRYRVLEITATVEAFENGRGYTLRVLRAGKPRENRKTKAVSPDTEPETG